MEQQQKKFRHKTSNIILETGSYKGTNIWYIINSQDWEEIVEEKYFKCIDTSNWKINIKNNDNKLIFKGSQTNTAIVIKGIIPKSILEISKEYPNAFKEVTKEEYEKEQAQPKVMIHKMYASNGDFELEISKDGIYYRPENSYLNPYGLDNTISTHLNDLSKMNGKGFYRIQISSIDVGCKKDTKIEDWKKALELYNSLQ